MFLNEMKCRKERRGGNEEAGETIRKEQLEGRSASDETSGKMKKRINEMKI